MADTVDVDLEFVKEAHDAFVGIDHLGEKRVFMKAKTIGMVKGDRLIVTVDRKSWERRLRRTPDRTPKMQKARKAQPKRSCLLCKSGFKGHPNERICQPCKNTADWGGPTEYSMGY